MKIGTRVKVIGEWWKGGVGVYTGDLQSGRAPFELRCRVELENGFSGMFRTEEIKKVVRRKHELRSK